MATAQYVKIKKAEALKALASQLSGVKVQVAKAVKVKGEDGVVRDGFETKVEPLAERHVLSAKKWANGQVTITTIDGRKYPEKANVLASDADGEEEAA